jgi:hypothetical protein
VDWWIGGLVDWWIGGLVDWWIGGLVDWWIGGFSHEQYEQLTISDPQLTIFSGNLTTNH